MQHAFVSTFGVRPVSTDETGATPCEVRRASSKLPVATYRNTNTVGLNAALGIPRGRDNIRPGPKGTSSPQ